MSSAVTCFSQTSRSELRELSMNFVSSDLLVRGVLDILAETPVDFKSRIETIFVWWKKFRFSSAHDELPLLLLKNVMFYLKLRTFIYIYLQNIDCRNLLINSALALDLKLKWTNICKSFDSNRIFRLMMRIDSFNTNQYPMIKKKTQVAQKVLKQAILL